jgi:hypothetical protein
MSGGDLLLPTAPRTGAEIPSAPHEHDDGKRRPQTEGRKQTKGTRTDVIAREWVR